MKLIYSLRKTLTEADNKTNVFCPFYIERELKKMEIRFSYSPKELDDTQKARRFIDEGFRKYAPEPYRKGYKPWQEYLPVLNLLTVSLDSPSGYVGCAHRQSPEQIHIFTENECSRGFVPQRLETGLWRVTVNVHALVSDECTFNLEVYGEER